MLTLLYRVEPRILFHHPARVGWLAAYFQRKAKR
jgi:hypothetical protein